MSNPTYQACTSTLMGVEAYDHSKTGEWNQTIIVRIDLGLAVQS